MNIVARAPLILAIDDPSDYEKAVGVVKKSCGIIEGYKIGIPILLARGVPGVAGLVEQCPSGLWVADLKLADIGHVMRLTISPLIGLFHAFIAHSFIGYRAALEELKKYLEDRDRKLVLVYSMSHPGGVEVYSSCLDIIDSVVDRVKPWGLVVGATTPSIIKRAARKYPSSVIMSPGIGVQGALPGDAICSGASYEIVGRSILKSENPLRSLREILALQERRVAECRSKNA